MNGVHLLIWNDRHSDPGAYPFTDLTKAVEAANAIATQHAWAPSAIRAEAPNGYAVWLSYSEEGDYVAVTDLTALDPNLEDLVGETP